MTLVAGVGHAVGLDSREAGMQATTRALNEMGNTPPVLGIVFIPYRFDVHQVIAGAASLLANVPLVGMSTSASLSVNGQQTHAVVIALFGGDEIQAEAHWFSGYSQSGAEAATRIMQLIGYEQRSTESLLVFGDGINGNAQELCESLPASYPLLGGLASGDWQNNGTFQFANNQNASSGLSAAFLRGKIQVGIGAAHGWSPVGTRLRVTRSRGFWLRTLDGHPSSESYAHLFGYPARDWAFPPLNYLVRLYPLGFEQFENSELAIRAPLRVEADGSFRMNGPLRDGSDGYLLIGSPASCRAAAETAARQALDQLQDASRPVLALVFVDLAWQMLMQATPDVEIQAIQEVLGPNIPIAGCYTIGQIIPASGAQEHPSFLNQHIVVALFAAK